VRLTGPRGRSLSYYESIGAVIELGTSTVAVPSIATRPSGREHWVAHVKRAPKQEEEMENKKRQK